VRSIKFAQFFEAREITYALPIFYSYKEPPVRHKIRVWDLPTRIFHWVLAVCVLALFVTSKIGGDAMKWHFLLGYSVLALLLFRLVWGVVGGHWSRFSSFHFTPAKLSRYLRGHTDLSFLVGHNPLGSLSVVAMLFFLLLQVATGLFSDDEIAASGPFSLMVSNVFVSQATNYHKAIGQLILIALVVVHVTAILVYLLHKRQNLIRPMVLGDKVVSHPMVSSTDDTRSRLKAIVIAISCVGLVIGLLQLAP
jgi:cytochrome b